MPLFAADAAIAAALFAADDAPTDIAAAIISLLSAMLSCHYLRRHCRAAAAFDYFASHFLMLSCYAMTPPR